MTYKKIFCLLVFLALLSSAQNITDIIQSIHLTPGRTDTLLVSDMFYAKSYSLHLGSAERVNAQFLPEKNLLILGTRDSSFTAALLPFELNGETQVIPLLVNASALTRTAHTFSFTGDSTTKNVFVEGSFNDWNKTSHPLVKNGKGEFETHVLLEPGSYTYKFIVNGKEIVDPKNPETAPTGFESFNSVLRVANLDTIHTFLHIKNYKQSGKYILFTFIFESNEENIHLLKNNIVALIGNNQVSESQIAIEGNAVTLSVPQKELSGDKIVRVFVSYGRHNTNIQQVQLFNGIPFGNSSLAKNKKFKTPWDDGIIYSIMVDRFNNGNTSNDNPVVHDSLFPQANYQGGDFRGIIKKIDDGYFDKLGISVLWISPVYDNPNVAFREYPPPHRYYSGYHGYWPINEFAVEEKFGTMKELKELVSKAHKHKIKVLLDIVAHHVHIDNPLYKEYRDWFGTLDLPDGRKNLRLWDEQRLTTWFEPYMPSFDYTKSTAPIDFMTDNCIWWLKETGADGFRHDAVKHVPNDFWRALTRKLQEKIEIPKQTTVYQIGETFGDYDLVASYVNNGQLSAQFNFNLSYFAIPVFLNPSLSFSTVDFQMKKSFDAFGVNNLMGNIMDSHDKVRFMAYADGDIAMQGVDTREIAWHNPPVVNNPKSYDKAKLYFAYLFTIPGLPVVYYGSEFGMTGADDPDNRRMMRFGKDLTADETTMLHSTQQSIKLRNTHSALRYGDFYTLQADTNIYAYMRADMNERLIIVLNKSDEAVSVNLKIPSVVEIHSTADVVSGEKIITQQNFLATKIPSMSYRIFHVEHSK